jgi:hypothetical protein
LICFVFEYFFNFDLASVDKLFDAGIFVSINHPISVPNSVSFPSSFENVLKEMEDEKAKHPGFLPGHSLLFLYIIFENKKNIFLMNTSFLVQPPHGVDGLEMKTQVFLLFYSEITPYV